MEIAIVLVVAFVIVIAFVAFVHVQRVRFEKRQKYTVLEVQVAKGDEKAPGPIAAEQLISTIHGISEETSYWDLFTGRRPPRVSFEIAHNKRKIKLYICFPSHLRNLIEGQIYAQYPSVEMREVEDYTADEKIEIEEQQKAAARGLVKKEDLGRLHRNARYRLINLYKHAVGAEIRLSDPDVYPIKRYPQFEDKLSRVAVDPLAGITATLAKLSHQSDQVWLQVVIRPLDDSWRVSAINCLRIVNKGIFLNIEAVQKMYIRLFLTRRKWIRIVFFPIFILFWFQGIVSGSKKKITINPLATDVGEDEDELNQEMTRGHDRETDMSSATDKVMRLLFETIIRVVYVPHEPDVDAADVKIREIASSFKQFDIPHLNTVDISDTFTGLEAVSRFRSRVLDDESCIFSNEELATIYHLPGHQVQTPSIDWVRSRKMEPPGDLPSFETLNEGETMTVLGKTNFRGSHDEFGIKTEDRRRHMYIIGKTGMGKSTLLENMIYHDIQSGHGVGVVDPHGDLADRVLDFIPASRTNDVVIFDPSDRDFPLAFNMLENVDPS
ncbi:MAG: DUF87 domain-containing protein, partial [Patescibacteria group bacterium]